MTRHLASTRQFQMGYSPDHPTITVSDSFTARPCSGGALVMAPGIERGTWNPQTGPVVQWPLPAAQPTVNGYQPWMGMDPAAPVSWVRAYSPQTGMVSRLNFDGAKLQGDTPMGGTWRNPMKDRADISRRRRRSRWWVR